MDLMRGFGGASGSSCMVGQYQDNTIAIVCVRKPPGLHHGRISAIVEKTPVNSSTEEKQLHVAKALAGLLSAQPGSVICGYQVGTLKQGKANATVIRGSNHQSFTHSPKTWSSLWDGEVFEKGSVEIETELVELPLRVEQLFMMKWSAVRL